MKKQKSLKINFIMNALLNMSSFIFPLIAFPYISRILLPQGVGKAAFAVSVATFFSLFAPVSYTHLDVYKRQASLHARFSGWMGERIWKKMQKESLRHIKICRNKSPFHIHFLNVIPDPPGTFL